jgi:hypothetical protein
VRLGAVDAADRTPWTSGLRQLTYVTAGQSPLRGDALAQRLADDIDPASRAELGEDVRDVGLHGAPAVGPADVPGRPQAVVQAGRLVQGDPGLVVLAAYRSTAAVTLVA